MYLYSVQRIVCNSSRVLSLTWAAPAAFAAMTLSASATSRMSRCAWRVAMTACIVGPKRLITSKNDVLECERTSDVNFETAANKLAHWYSSRSLLRISNSFASSAGIRV